MNEEILNNILSEDNFDKLQNIINVIEDKEELIELYNEVKDEFQSKAECYKNRKSSILSSLKNFFVDDIEAIKMKNLIDAATFLAKKREQLVYNEMFKNIEKFLSYSCETANNTIRAFIYFLPEIKNHCIDANDYKKCVEYLNNTDKRLKQIKTTISNNEIYKKYRHFTGFEKLKQEISAENQDKGIINGVTLAGSLAYAAATEDVNAAAMAAKQGVNWIKSSDDNNKIEILRKIDVEIEYLEITEKVISDFEKIINTIQDLTEKIEKLDEEISDLDEYFEPIVADYDEKDVYCVQTFNKYSGLISSMHTLLMTEIL